MYRKAVRQMFEIFLSRSGTTTQALRSSVLTWAERGGGISAEIPTALQPYLTKVAHSAYKITDDDITQLQTEGYSEDNIFELTIAAALGVSKQRLDAGLQLLQELD